MADGKMGSYLDELQDKDSEIERLRQTLNEVTVMNNDLREEVELARRNKVEIAE